MKKHSIKGYNNETLSEEIVRRLQQGKDLQQYNVLNGTLTFYGRPQEKGWRYGVKEGSQRYIALRNLFTDKELMKEMMDRILGGERHAYNEFKFALQAGRCALFSEVPKKKRNCK